MSIQDEIAAIAAGFEGAVALAARDLLTGAEVAYHPDRKCPTASVIKLPVLVHTALLVHEGAAEWGETLTLRDEDKVPGSGILTQLTAGLAVSLRDAVMLMIALSDNTATNMVLDRVGIAAVNARAAALGLKRTRLFRKVFSTGPPVCEENRRYGLGVSTARDTLRLLAGLHNGSVPPEVASSVRHFLAAQHYRDGIPRLLPASWEYAGKGGAVDAVRNDVGYITPAPGHHIALAIFCSRMPRPLWTVDNPGLLAIARLARAVTAHFTGGGEQSPDAPPGRP